MSSWIGIGARTSGPAAVTPDGTVRSADDPESPHDRRPGPADRSYTAG
ncbi:hypothetical protein ACFVW2_09170 [Streptomyces sp. NPDC058171]